MAFLQRSHALLSLGTNDIWNAPKYKTFKNVARLNVQILQKPRTVGEARGSLAHLHAALLLSCLFVMKNTSASSVCVQFVPTTR